MSPIHTVSSLHDLTQICLQLRKLSVEVCWSLSDYKLIVILTSWRPNGNLMVHHCWTTKDNLQWVKSISPNLSGLHESCMKTDVFIIHCGIFDICKEADSSSYHPDWLVDVPVVSYLLHMPTTSICCNGKPNIKTDVIAVMQALSCTSDRMKHVEDYDRWGLQTFSIWTYP